MRPMFEGPVTDYLMRRTHDGMLVSRTINFFGVGESELEARLREMMVSSTNPTIAPYAKTSEVQLRVTARAATEEEGLRLIEPVVQKIVEIYPDQIYGFDFHAINEAVVKRYTDAGKTLAAAESCTGGLIASRLVDLPARRQCSAAESWLIPTKPSRNCWGSAPKPSNGTARFPASVRWRWRAG